MKYILLIITLSSSLAFAQDSVYVELLVKSKKYGEPIQNVDITFIEADTTYTRKSNMKGKVLLRLPIAHTVELAFKHVMFYADNDFLKTTRRFTEDTLKYEFFVKQTQELPGTVVKAPGIPDTVFGSKRLHVEDFEINQEGNLILLVYPKRLKKGSELVYFDGLKVLKSFEVPDHAKELVRDYRGNPHVVCENNVFGIHAKQKEIGISNLPKEYFLKYLAPILDTNETKMYFSTFNPDYPAFDYFSFDQLDSTYTKIMAIEDELMMELYRSEIKWVDVRTKIWAHDKERATGIDAEIWVGANYFTQSLYYEELYAPLFHRNDSIFVFDYYRDKLYTYDKYGVVLDSVGIYHHYNARRTGWERNVIQDRETGEVYAVFERDGYSFVGRIDVTTGEISEQVKLEFKYADKIGIHGNFVYYIYRPFESIQKKYLYRERLPYSFGKAELHNGDDFLSRDQN